MGELLSKNDIVSVVSGYVSLKPKGRNLWGLCPFHGEKTPSFSVSPDKQMYYCFGCHAGGSVIQFIMAAERLEFTDAVKALAERAGMEMPGVVDDAKIQRERAFRERLYAANKEAALFYNSTLLSDRGAAAKQYLSKRGIDSKVITRFGLGFAPEGWNNLTAHLESMGFTREELIGADLAIAKESSYYDKYRGRVIFPIVGTNGRVLGFGARTLGSEQPKYVNTGDTPIFNKRNNLYGLNLLRGKKNSDLVIVEGYTDVIALNKSGITNAAASLGTALTVEQARLAKRYTASGKVYISYDGDSAGQESMVRGLDILVKEGLSVKVIVIPDGKDPDEFVKANGKDAFEALKDRSLTVPAFKLERLAAKADLSTEDGREAYAVEACRFIATLQPVERERYAGVVSQKTGLSKEALMSQVGAGAVDTKNSIGNYRNTRDKKPQEIPSERIKAEGTLAACLAKGRDAAMYILGKFPPDRFSEPAYENFALELLSAYAEETDADAALILSHMRDEEAEKVAGLFAGNAEIEDPKAVADDCIKAIGRADVRREIAELTARADSPGIPDDEKRALLKTIAEKQKQLL
jgi:DNA primase